MHFFLLYRQTHTLSPQLGALTRRFLASMSGTDSITALYCRFWWWNKESGGGGAGLAGEAVAAGDESKREERDSAMCARMRS